MEGISESHLVLLPHWTKIFGSDPQNLILWSPPSDEDFIACSPILSHSSCEEFFPYIQPVSALLQHVVVAPCAPSTNLWEGDLVSLPLEMVGDWNFFLSTLISFIPGLYKTNFFWHASWSSVLAISELLCQTEVSQCLSKTTWSKTECCQCRIEGRKQFLCLFSMHLQEKQALEC